MTAQGDWLQRLRDRGALIEGHFQLSSGMHSPHYVQCARLLQHPGDATEAATALAERLKPSLSEQPVAVVSPAIGGIVLGHEVARAFDVRAIWAERDQATGDLVFRRGFSLDREEAIVAVEDVVTTGGSLRELVELARQGRARVLGVATLVDRSGGKSQWDVPSAALVEIEGLQYDPDNCPLCVEDRPLVKPGSRPAASF